MSNNNKYYDKSFSPLGYVANGQKGVMRSINWNVINDPKDLEV